VRVVDVVASALPAGRVVTSESERRAHAHDYWALEAIHDLGGTPAEPPPAVVYPEATSEVATVLEIAQQHRAPVVPYGLGSGVCGGVRPGREALVVDLSRMNRVVEVRPESLVAVVQAGLNGGECERRLGEHGLTLGHFPQSIDRSTVGGWVATRASGQLSTRYGNIEDLVLSLEVVLPGGRVVRTFPAPRASTGPDLRALFLGSEGTLGIVTGVRLRVHPVPTHERRGAWAFASVADGLDACRRILRRGGTPAVLRLYDGVESDRNYHVGTDKVVVLALDEGDRPVVDGCFAVVEDVMSGAERLDDSLVDHWLAKRKDVAALEALIKVGAVVDTMEVSGAWSDLPAAYDAVVAAMSAVPGVLAASAHCSHSYLTGGCLYFTFGGRPEVAEGAEPTVAEREALHRAVWEAGQRAALAHGMSVSHHHGVGLHRGQYLPDALGGGFAVLAALKAALDPTGILNPGKLGLPSPFGPVELP